MITYEENSSPYFIANKNYCEMIADQLKTINVDCSGFCNSYGYDIEAAMEKNNLRYNLKFHKHQSTRVGVIPLNAIDYAGTVVTVNGLNKKYKIAVGKSSFLRLFTAKKYRDRVSNPYYIKLKYSPDNNFFDNLIKVIKENKISN